jgi:hypothetical protein
VETVVRIFWVRIFLVAPEVMHESGYAQQVGDLEGDPKGQYMLRSCTLECAFY